MDPTIELSLISLTEVQIGDSITITATLTKNALPFVNREIEYEITSGSTVIDSGSDFTNNAGQITISYTGTGIGDIEVSATYGSLEETISIEDCIKVGFTGWTGTYTTGTDTYDYLCPTNAGVSPNATLPSEWIMTYKFKDLDTTASGQGSCLWNIGADTNNGALIGHEGTNSRIRVYARSGGSNTVHETQTYTYNYNTWTDAVVKYQNGTLSVTVGGKTVSYSVASTVIMQTWGNYPQCRLAEFNIKAL